MNVAMKPSTALKKSSDDFNYTQVFHKTNVKIQKAVRALEVLTTNDFHIELLSTYPHDLKLVEQVPTFCKISCRHIAIPLMLKISYPAGYVPKCTESLMKIYASLSSKEPGPSNYDFIKEGKPKSFAIFSPKQLLEAEKKEGDIAGLKPKFKESTIYFSFICEEDVIINVQPYFPNHLEFNMLN